MFNKLIITLLLCSSTFLAHTNNYTTKNYTAWNIVNADVENKYVVVKPKGKANVDFLKPICYTDDIMIFKYQIMIMEDSFFDKNSQPKSLKTITNSRYKNRDYLLKIELETDDNLAGKMHVMDSKICKANNAKAYISNSKSKPGFSQNGVIKYIGDLTIPLPF